jgi:glucose/arabinose dehydrogenase
VDDRTPVATAVHAGNGQSATVGTVVPVRPALRVTDRAGRGVASMSVTFSVLTGGGSVTGAAQMTDANGVATVGGWTLGSTAGPQQLEARTAGLPAVSFSATALAPAGAPTMDLVSGDAQSATVGTAVTNAPSVRVRNGAGQPVQGVNVSFAVTSGGGSVQAATATSDATGLASAMRWTLGSTVGAQTLTATATGYPSVTFRATAVAATDPVVVRSTVVGGLSTPWDIAFTPDGTMLFTERGGGLGLRLTDGTVRRGVFRPADLVAQDQSGMLGIAVDPAFATNRAVYVYMASTLASSTGQSGTNNRVVRLTANADFTAFTNRVDIVTGISYAGGAHSGGRIKFGPDGYLYITTGDNRIGEIPQLLTVLGSKVLRVDRDGNAAPGNATPAGGDPRIYTFGHRNPQGIDFRPANGVAYTGEHGPGHDDEVTALAAGRNAGWDPLCRPEMSGYCGYSRPTPMTDLARFPTALPPVWSTGGFGGRPGRSEGMADVAFLRGSQWRTWEGRLAVALLAGTRVEVLQLSADGASTVGTTSLFTNLNPRVRIRALEMGPDSALYATTDTGEIWRVAPQ